MISQSFRLIGAFSEFSLNFLLARKRAREAEQLAVIDSGELEGSSAKKIKTEEGDDTNDNDEGGGDVGSSDSD
uniref:Uncharacterized protein n=1 Tax=Caenorhabditis japonica TaxID=281687 RepID=A0A8R1I8C8_CAEJA